MQSLSQSVLLEGAASREALLHACRRLAAVLSEKMAARELVWQEISVKIWTESGAVTGVTRLASHRRPDSIYVNLENLISRLEVPAPVESLTVSVSGLAPAQAEQLRLFDSCPDRQPGLINVMREVNRLYPCALVWASSIGVERREKMLAFYDPVRQARALARAASSG